MLLLEADCGVGSRLGCRAWGWGTGVQVKRGCRSGSARFQSKRHSSRAANANITAARPLTAGKSQANFHQNNLHPC